MKTLSILWLVVVMTGCFSPGKPSGLLGTWFDWRLGKEVFVLEADGSGAWKGSSYRRFTWAYDPKSRVVTFTELDGRAPVFKLIYSESDGTLVHDDGGLNAERTRRGETPISLFVAVNDISKSVTTPKEK